MWNGFIWLKISRSEVLLRGQLNGPYVKVMEFLDHITDHKLFKKDPVACSLFLHFRPVFFSIIQGPLLAAFRMAG
jgi:hypothetical protein